MTKVQSQTAHHDNRNIQQPIDFRPKTKTRAPVLYKSNHFERLLKIGQIGKMIDGNARILLQEGSGRKEFDQAVRFFCAVIKDLGGYEEAVIKGLVRCEEKQVQTVKHLLSRAITVLVSACQHSNRDSRSIACDAFVRLYQRSDTRLMYQLGDAMIVGACRTRFPKQPTVEFARILNEELEKSRPLDPRIDPTMLKDMKGKVSQWLPRMECRSNYRSHEPSGSLTVGSNVSFTDSVSDTVTRELMKNIHSLKNYHAELRGRIFKEDNNTQELHEKEAGSESKKIEFIHEQNKKEKINRNEKQLELFQNDKNNSSIKKELSELYNIEKSNQESECKNENILEKKRSKKERFINPRINNFEFMNREKFKRSHIHKLSKERIYIDNYSRTTGYEMFDFKRVPVSQTNMSKCQGNPVLREVDLTGETVLKLMAGRYEKDVVVVGDKGSWLYTFKIEEDRRKNSPVRDPSWIRRFKSFFEMYEL